MKSLRALWLGMFAAVALIVVASAVALIVVTTLLHKTTSETVKAVESLLLLQRMERLLLPSEVSLSSPEHAKQALARLLDQASTHHAGDAEGSAAVAEARRHMEAFFRKQVDLPTGNGPPELRQAVLALHRLAEHNGRQARALELQSAEWDRAGDTMGYGSLGLVVMLAALLSLVSRRMIQPARELAEVIHRYAAGQRSTRAAPDGPEELQAIAAGFNEMAEELDRETGRRMAFLGGVAHDLRNPLLTLRLTLAVVHNDDGPLPPEPAIRQAFARTERQLGRLERMIHDFLDSARIESGALELQLEVCDMRDLIPQVVDLFQSTSAAHQLKSEAPSDPVHVRCDPLRIEQVLINLVSNAIKYSPSGGEVAVRVTREENHVRVAVCDQGIGVEEADRVAIFRPFGRSGASRETIPGVGLGLYVARRIAEAHGGSLDLESAPGRGSTFALRLPLVAAAPPATTPRS
jgi:signal transduction histidine kinase